MLKRLVTLFVLLSGFTVLPGATYYISPTGNDNNPGTLSQPWATYPKAVSVSVAGDTVLVQPGIYSSASNANFYTWLFFPVSGTSNAPITYRALGPVTNQITFSFIAPYYYIDGFTWDGVTGVSVYGPQGGGMPGPGSHHVTMTNCTVQNVVSGDAFYQAPPTTTGNHPETAPGYCTVINNLFKNLAGAYGVVAIEGVGNLVQGNLIADCDSCRAFSLMGSNNIIRLNTVTNLHASGGYGIHGNIIIISGDNNSISVSNLFERNYVVGGDSAWQFMDVSMQATYTSPSGLVTNNSSWGLIVQNNVFEDANMQCSIELPNFKFYNNTFRRCTGGGLVFAFYDPDFWMPYDTSTNLNWMCRGWATGGEAKNNVFIDSPYYSVVPGGPDQGVLTNGSGTVVGNAKIWCATGFKFWGTYSNLVGTVTNGALCYLTGGVLHDLYRLTATNFDSGRFYRSISTSDLDLNGNDYAHTAAFGPYYSGLLRVRLDTDSGTNAAVSENLAVYDAGAPAAAVLTNSDYNYGGAVGEPHGLQSGDTKLVATNSWPATLAAPMLGSVLIDAGTNLSSLGVTNDFSGTARPQGNRFDIGAFGYTGVQTQSQPNPPGRLWVVSPGM